MNEPKVYRHKPFQLIILVIFFAIISVVVFSDIGTDGIYVQIPFAAFMGIIFLVSLYSMTVKTIISDTEISTQSILGTKSLAWNEIGSVSGKGPVIKLHNLDGDVTVTPSQQLPGYDEVIEWIGAKRPDLFDPLKYSEMKRGWSIFILLGLFGVLFIGAIVGPGLLFLSEPETPIAAMIMPAFFVIFIALVYFGTIFFSPQSVMIEGKSVILKYLFSEKTLLADEITSVELRFTQTRYGKNYFVQFTQRNKKTLRISGLNISMPVAYLVFKNWHKKNMGIGQAIQNDPFS